MGRDVSCLPLHLNCSLPVYAGVKYIWICIWFNRGSITGHEAYSRGCASDPYLRTVFFVLSYVLGMDRCLLEWSSIFFFSEWWSSRFISIVSNIVGEVWANANPDLNVPDLMPKIQRPPMDQIIRKSYFLPGISYINLGQVFVVFTLDAINSVCDCVYLYDSLILHFGKWWIKSLVDHMTIYWADDTNFLLTANWGEFEPSLSRLEYKRIVRSFCSRFVASFSPALQGVFRVLILCSC